MSQNREKYHNLGRILKKFHDFSKIWTKSDGAAAESSSNRERIVRNSSCQEFWNLEQES